MIREGGKIRGNDEEDRVGGKGANGSLPRGRKKKKIPQLTSQRVFG